MPMRLPRPATTQTHYRHSSGSPLVLVLLEAKRSAVESVWDGKVAPPPSHASTGALDLDLNPAWCSWRERSVKQVGL